MFRARFQSAFAFSFFLVFGFVFFWFLVFLVFVCRVYGLNVVVFVCRVYGLNLVVPEDARAVIKPWDERDDTTRYVQSGVDDQVVLHVPFTRIVRVRSVLLKLGEPKRRVVFG